MRLMACHASSANRERIFSTLGRLFSPDRNRLSLKTAFDMLTVQLSLRPPPREPRLAEDNVVLENDPEISLEATLFSLGIHYDIADFDEEQSETS